MESDADSTSLTVSAETVRLVESASDSIVCSLWEKEAEQLQPYLEKALGRGVDITLFSFTKLPPHLGNVFSYGINARELALGR